MQGAEAGLTRQSRNRGKTPKAREENAPFWTQEFPTLVISRAHHFGAKRYTDFQ